VRKVVYREVVGFPGYRVGDDGSVWSSRTPGNEHVVSDWRRKATGLRNGYPTVQLCRRGGASTRTVHRVVLEAFVGFRPPGYECRHLDGDRTNNRLENICWGTPQENEADKVRHGRRFGVANPTWAKLSPEKVVNIRRRFASGDATARELGREFGVTHEAIYLLIRRKTWANVP
jgi:hypothetical protein